MVTFLKTPSVLAAVIWPWSAVIANTALAGSRNIKNVLWAIGTTAALYYPVFIFSAYWAAEASLLGADGRTLCLVSFFTVTAALYATGYFRTVRGHLQGVESFGYSVTRFGVYYNGNRLPAIDPETFRPLAQDSGTAGQEADYYIDRHSVVLYGKVITHADPNSFHLIRAGSDEQNHLSHFWADAHSVFYDGKQLKGASSSDFTRLSEFYCRSHGRIYHTHHELTNVDADSFTVLSAHFAQDKLRVFYNHRAILPMADSASFELITLQGNEPSFATDKRQVYLLYTDVHSRPLEFVDRKTVTFLSESYFKDARAVYYREFEKVKELTDADPNTFELVRYSAKTPYDARDKNGVFDNGVASFTL